MNRARVATVIITSSLFVFPLASFAQENQPQPGAYCPHLTQDLQRRDCDEDITSSACRRHVSDHQVTELQTFLVDYYDLNPDTYISGYFGGKTQQNVINFQREQNLPAYGYVGPLTRTAIANACGSHSTNTPPPTDLSCVWNGQTVAHRSSITAYQASSVPSGSQCVSEQRTCNNGTLSGSYQYASCSVQAAQNQSCTFNGQTVAHGASVYAYQVQGVDFGMTCESVRETRTCTNGTLSGSNQFSTCSVSGGSVSPTPPTITAKTSDDVYPSDTVTITGTNFVSPNDILLDNVVQQTVGSTENNTKLSFLIPSTYPGSETNHTLTVRNANGTSNGSSLRVHGSQGGITDISVAAASRGSDRIDTFGRGTDGALWHKWWNGSSWSGWESLGGALTSGPAAAWCPTCQLDVFSRGTDNALWRRSYNGSSWSNWESLGGVLTSAPAAATRASGVLGGIRIDVFGRGTDNALWHKWWNGSSWSNWESLGGVLTSAPAVSACPTCRLDVFARGTDNAIWHKSYDNSTWSEWESLGGSFTSGPAAATRAIGDNSIRIDVFGRGTDNALWHKWWNGTSWSGWESLGGILTSSPAVSYCPTCDLRVFARGTDNALWQRAYDGRSDWWSPWESLGGILTSADKNSNLANALSALQAALQAIAQLLKQ